MRCPKCEYTPVMTGDGDYCEGEGRFYTLGVEMKQEQNLHSKYETKREPLLGCPRCGVVFINVASGW